MIRPKPYFEKEVVAWLLEDDGGRQRTVEVRLTGFKKRRISTWEGFVWRPGERAIAARLTCGHWHRLTRLWTPETKYGPTKRARGPMSKNAPCKACGAGNRGDAERSRAKEMLAEAVARAGRDCLLLPSLVECVWEAMRASRLAPKSEEQEAIFTAIDRHARMARLQEGRGEDEDDPVSDSSPVLTDRNGGRTYAPDVNHEVPHA